VNLIDSGMQIVQYIPVSVSPEFLRSLRGIHVDDAYDKIATEYPTVAICATSQLSSLSPEVVTENTIILSLNRKDEYYVDFASMGFQKQPY
jgi:hypothetical protein